MVQKVEVITSVARRRRFSLAEKGQIVAETLEPGATVAGVARRHGISASLLFAWRRAVADASASNADCRPVPGIAADIVRQIEAELAACRQSSPKDRRRIRATPRLRGLVAEALAAGLTPTRIAVLTGLPRSTVKSWWDAKAEPPPTPATQAPPPRELALVEVPTLRPPAQPAAAPIAGGNAKVRVGTSVTIELPVEALTEAVLRALLAAGGGR